MDKTPPSTPKKLDTVEIEIEKQRKLLNDEKKSVSTPIIINYDSPLTGNVSPFPGSSSVKKNANEFDLVSCMYINFEKYNNVEKNSFTVYRIKKLCQYMLVDVILVLIVIFIEFIVPFLMWFAVFWKFQFPTFVDVLEEVNYVTKIVVSVNGYFQICIGCVFSTLLLLSLVVDFMYVVLQLKLRFSERCFLLIWKVLTFLEVLFLVVKFFSECVVLCVADVYLLESNGIYLFIYTLISVLFRVCFLLVPMLNLGVMGLVRCCGCKFVEEKKFTFSKSVEKIPRVYLSVFVWTFVVYLFMTFVESFLTCLKVGFWLCCTLCNAKKKIEDEEFYERRILEENINDELFE